MKTAWKVCVHKPVSRAAVFAALVAAATTVTSQAADQTNAVVVTAPMAAPVHSVSNYLSYAAVYKTVQEAEQTNNVRLLTLQECIARALANNFDVRIQRINPSIQNWNIVLAQGAYDPVLTGSIEDNSSLTPVDRGPGAPAGIDNLRTTPGQVALGGKFVSGATYSVTASENRYDTSPSFGTNFLYSGTTALQVTQPLLKNFGFDSNTAAIRIARKSHDIAVQSFLLQMITSISAVDNAYYELIYAIESFKDAKQDLALAQALLDQTTLQVKIGTASPLDVVEAESGVAQRQQTLILDARLIKDDENALKLLISQNVTEFKGSSLVPTNYPDVEPVETDLARSTNIALQRRPDYLAAIQAVEQQDIQVKFNHNQLWPEIDLNGSYGWNGGANNLGNTVDSEASGRYPVWAAGVSLTIPLGNRQARANYHSARLLSEQLLLQLKSLEQQIIVGVDDAVGHVRTKLEAVQATRAATGYAQASYEAEKTKLLVGTSTPVLVLQQESILFDAKAAQVRAEADYREALVALAQVEGTTLQKHHIELNENF